MRTILLAAVAVFGVQPAFAHEVIHGGHEHAHGRACGHASLSHAGHVDYLHDGHLHHGHAIHMDEHAIEVSKANPARERRAAAGDAHSAEDGHAVVQHGDHFDHVHNGRLHHAHGGHADDHGAVKVTG